MKLRFSDLTGKVYDTKKIEVENFIDIVVMFLIFHEGSYEFEKLGKKIKISLNFNEVKNNKEMIYEQYERKEERGMEKCP